MKDKLYIQVFSIHGLLRYHGMELGKDADTGGQIKYVVEMAEALSRQKEVGRVDLFTRLLADRRVSQDYSVAVEPVSDKCRIVRIQCGGKQYIRKELLWPHLDEFIDKTIKFMKKEKTYPDLVHGHYADGGYICMQLSEYFGVPFIFTGHSLGKPKEQKLLSDGMNPADMDKRYHIQERIFHEEEIIKHADMIITSTEQEIEKQYGMYTNQNLARYEVIPPGIDLKRFYPYYHDMMPEMPTGEANIQARASMMEELNRFFLHPDKPLILSICRPDKKKNIAGLIEAYGGDRELQTMANLAIFAGLRKNISEMQDNEKAVLTEMLLLMDKHDLYGKMAIPKKHDFTYEVPELYRIAARKKGVFVNVAMTEPFGLTLIEASASGVPIVATHDGGPRDILKNCRNGILVDPTNCTAISRAIRIILSDNERWKQFSVNGINCVKNIYAWGRHCRTYLEKIRPLLSGVGTDGYKRSAQNPVGNRLTRLKRLLVTDIDNTLIGDQNALDRFMDFMKSNIDQTGFAVATGRTVDSALKVLEQHGVFLPDIIISSVGAEIYYAGKSFTDRGWQSHIAKNWNREKIKSILDTLDFLTYQEADTQRDFKISYYMETQKDRLAQIHDLMTRNRCHYNLIYSHGRFLDILPHRASKGKAIRYLSYKWSIDLNNILVCGDSGNDMEMLSGGTLGVVVANYAEELEALRGRRSVYFSPRAYADGIPDGIKKYRLTESENSSSEQD
ncbi:MAG: HAD-IIB family hydrolase [Desulfobacterales bacterium]|nr:HAD-IIB family hydrolase [Desulfobacterales bacterium]